MPINLPFVTFECGHQYHNLCLGSDIINENIQCRKCKEAKKKIIEESKNNKNFYNTVNTLDKLEKELNKCNDKLDFIHKLYGKGLFNLGPIKDNKKEKEKE